MNVVLPEKPKILNKRNVTILTILVLCAVAIAFAVYQFFSEEKLDVILGFTRADNEEVMQLKAEFNNLFTNKIVLNQKIDNIELKKNDVSKDIVYTGYEKKEEAINDFNLDVKIPTINIESDVTEEFNEEINNNFQRISEDVLETKERNIIYTVNYLASIQNNILSICIMATFKEGGEVQRTFLQSFNYNIEKDCEVDLNDFKNIKKIDNNILKSTIEKDIKDSQEQAKNMEELGYNIFLRNPSDDMYKVENISNYFMYDKYLFIVYAYGNTKNTSEMDIVII